MTYKIVPTPKFAKSFKKLDPFVRKQIKSYLNRITDNPRAKGKALVANRTGQWRYRIGAYRVIVNIQDNELIILALEVGHRRDIY
ncbi:addiction module toxin RelE [Streptococcus salivarius]|uniref:type II toxin-antitoxin system RelE family toxin n=1 Tax=Streptococcus salivarius TaxID=1304 RepID=UPI000535D652|nr:type II toxin-antitoxin system RelE/ParE family toxin [Streptococcus salivarius]AIY21451.1 toxin-antitoxin system, toxin component, RelE family protein [Streptococcus salivarius]AMB83076.1 addiction module toxin RelE [Streptococcus salivarius]MBF1718999.1 type II toxin-antitoxin system RelE/ParE family toxin [Streptococcus salivarius]MEB3644492.1 type II toxin-antitoxin system RelE/ParE family toxin [Streptococcus salivarius]WMS34842.1 type II toxin-antitoxin system RelE/ParE family toxin [